MSNGIRIPAFLGKIQMFERNTNYTTASASILISKYSDYCVHKLTSTCRDNLILIIICDALNFAINQSGKIFLGFQVGISRNDSLAGKVFNLFLLKNPSLTENSSRFAFLICLCYLCKSELNYAIIGENRSRQSQHRASTHLINQFAISTI